MRIVISGGGTGGHIYPALAVARHLQDIYQCDMLYLGSDDGLETEIVPAQGFPFVAIKAGKLQRYLSWSTLMGIARVPVGIMQAIRVVRNFRPDVVFTSGGYVAVPAGIAAYMNRVPLIMHQQDVSPNLANKVIAPFASRITVAFADSLAYFPERKVVHVGNPVRQALLDVRQTPLQQARQAFGFAEKLPLVLVTGGSQGARHINQAFCHALPELLTRCQVLQISGKRLYEETHHLSEHILTRLNEEERRRYRLVAYMDAEMPLALQAADIVICRAGAATLSELAVLGKPSVLIPFPPAIGSSPQETNADLFQRNGAAQVIRDADLTAEKLTTAVLSLLESPTALQAMADAARALAMPQATEDIVKEIVGEVR